MRQAVNNLQSTYSGFGFVGAEEVFKVCDQPHPVKVQNLIRHCQKGELDEAMTQLEELWVQGYAAVDIVGTLFRVVKGMDALAEYTKLEFIRVSTTKARVALRSQRADELVCPVQEIGFTHMRILEGVSTVVQLGGLLARLCKLSMKPELFVV